LISFEAEMLRKSKGPAAALPLVEDFARENWWHAGAAIALGRLRADAGDGAGAETSLRHASWLDVHDAQALNLLAQIKLRQNKLDDACATQRRAVARQPDEPRQYLLLSDILRRMGRGDEARIAHAQFEQLQSVAHAAEARSL
jgi:Flp pilus assembly protein TadD